jgi:hypothetical protein
MREIEYDKIAAIEQPNRGILAKTERQQAKEFRGRRKRD